MQSRFPLIVAYKTLNLMIERKAILYPGRKAFYVWQLLDRVLVMFDTEIVDLSKLNDDFTHRLSTRLNGRLVVRTNSRGLFLQVDPLIPPAPMPLEEIALDLSLQPSPVHVPVGVTGNGPLWISFTQGDSFLIGGSRGGGKTGLEHAWIQALLHGGQVIIHAWDGKRGAEFGRYAGQEHFKLLFRGFKDLQELEEMLKVREQLLTSSGFPNILLYNEANPHSPIKPIALFVDEAADLPDQAKELLKGMIRLYRHVGLYPVIATNQPTQAEVFAKTNLSTRVAFRVPHHNDSITMLGYKGAEALSDVRGRGLIVWKGRFVEFQSFQVTYPMPSEEARQILADQLQAGSEASEPVGEIARLAESIRENWNPSMSKRQVAKLLGKEYAGGFAGKVDKIIEILSATTTGTTYLPAIKGLGA